MEEKVKNNNDDSNNNFKLKLAIKVIIDKTKWISFLSVLVDKTENNNWTM